MLNNPNGTNVYYIWYGNWSNSPVPGILTDFIQKIGGTAYFNINSSYYDYIGGATVPVVNRVNYGGSTTDRYSYGTPLTDDDVGCIIQNAATSGKLPYDPNNGVYEVLTSPDVIETSGFCTTYCAFHGYQQPGFVCGQGKPLGQNLIGGFIGNPDQCPSGCAWQSQLPTPNNSVAADGMANSIAHGTVGGG